MKQAADFFEKKTGADIEFLWLEEEGDADLFQIAASDFADVDAATLLDLTEMAEKSGYAEKSHEVLRNQITDQCGFLGAVAQVPYLGGVYYNADIFTNCDITEMPRSWEAFEETAATLKAAGWEPLTLDKEDAVAAMELHLRRTIGNEEMRKYMGKKDHWHFDQTVIAAMEQVMLFVQAGYMTYGTPTDYPVGQNKMGISNSAMMVGTNGDCRAIEEETLTDLRWGMFPFPGELESGTWMEADMIAIRPDCENPQAAFDFIMLLTRGEFDQLYADVTQGIPADPANECSIEGALKLLETADVRGFGLLTNEDQELFSRLWNGYYKTGAYFANQLNTLSYQFAGEKSVG